MLTNLCVIVVVIHLTLAVLQLYLTLDFEKLKSFIYVD